MEKYISKSDLVAEIYKLKKSHDNWSYMGKRFHQDYEILLSFIDTLEVKEVGDNSLEKFKSLQHIDKDLHQTLEDWGYAPNLYYFDGSWHVDWISCEEGDSIKCFTEDIAEEAIDKAYNWFHSTFCNG